MQARVKFIHRIAAVSGCSAVALGAIGAHKVSRKKSRPFI